MIISDTAIRNRTTVGVMIVVIIVFGAYSYMTLPRENSPDIPIPYIIVSTSYEGVSPEDIETSITIKIEKELAGLKGVKEITSSSVEGMSNISVEFLPDVPTDTAMQYVRDKVELAKAELPEEAEETNDNRDFIRRLPNRDRDDLGRHFAGALEGVGGRP